MTNRDKLTAAFRHMRKAGYVARQNFSCCGGCASSELGDVLDTKPEKLGAAYYHRQDGERINRDRNPAEEVWLGFGASPHATHVDDEEAGWAVCRALAKAGLSFEWNGSGSMRVCVKLPGGADAEVSS